MGPRACLGGCRKSRPPPGFDPQTVQSVASRYTAIPVYMMMVTMTVVIIIIIIHAVQLEVFGRIVNKNCLISETAEYGN